MWEGNDPIGRILFFIEPFWEGGATVNIFHSAVRHLRRASSGFVCINCIACWKKRTAETANKNISKKDKFRKHIYFFTYPFSSCFFVTLNTWYHLVVFLGEGERDSLWIFTVHTRHWWPLESWIWQCLRSKKELSGDSIQCKNQYMNTFKII